MHDIENEETTTVKTPQNSTAASNKDSKAAHSKEERVNEVEKPDEQTVNADTLIACSTPSVNRHHAGDTDEIEGLIRYM